jgi:hypothetical protein
VAIAADAIKAQIGNFRRNIVASSGGVLDVVRIKSKYNGALNLAENGAEFKGSPNFTGFSGLKNWRDFNGCRGWVKVS